MHNIFDNIADTFGDYNIDLMNLVIVLIFVVIIWYGNIQLLSLVLLLFLIISFIKSNNNDCDYERLQETEFDDLIKGCIPDYQEDESNNPFDLQNTTIENDNNTEETIPKEEEQPEEPNKEGFVVQPQQVVNKEGSYCELYAENYNLPDDADDRFALINRQKFVATKPKRQDINFAKYLHGAKLDVYEKRDWWEEYQSDDTY